MKRPISQLAPEPVTETIHGTTIVVIHPGSRNLYFGKASDSRPLHIPHCIAWRNLKGNQPNKNEGLNRKECQHQERSTKMKIAIKSAEEALISRPNNHGEFRHHYKYKEVLHINQKMEEKEGEIYNEKSWTDVSKEPEYVIGDEALFLNPSDNYNLHWPMKYGRLNLHNGPHGSMSAIMQNLETLWTEAIENFLDIPPKDFRHYRCMLLVPDIYDRWHLRELVNLLLIKMGFGAAFLVQESVCATFGCGVPSACVIDIGDQKTSVSCVEDGLSHKDTRFHMDFGGQDVTRSFYYMLTRIAFPYKECNLSSSLDILFLNQLKESVCHLVQETSGSSEKTIEIRIPGQKVKVYKMTIGDEKILASMAYFFPGIFGFQEGKYVYVQERNKGDSEDPFDEFYLQQTQVRYMKKKETGESSYPTYESSLNQFDDVTNISQPNYDEDSCDPPDTIASADQSIQGKSTKKSEPDEDFADDEVPDIMAIDEAILKSIDNCETEEMKKRMYSCILVVGGGFMFLGAQEWLQYRIWTQMPGHYRLQLETMDVITKPKDMDPTLTSWKGAAIMSCLDTAQELWIKQREWKENGLKLLRERAPFIW